MSEAIELTNGSVTVRVDPGEGTFDLLAGDRHPVLADGAISVVLADGARLSIRGTDLRLERGPEVIEDELGAASVLHVRADARDGLSLGLTVAVYHGEPFVVLGCDLRNDTPNPVRVARFDVLEGARLDLGSPPSAWRFYKHGWQSWSPTLVLDCAGEDLTMAPPVNVPGTQPEAAEGRFVSELMTAIVSSESGHGVVAGFVTTGEQMSQVWLDREDRTLAAASYADGISVPPGGWLGSERLLVEPTRSPLEAMERYGDALGRAMGARPSDDVASGWCSWYYYWQSVAEEGVLASLEELRRRRHELPLEYVQVDDGWQAEIGDWLTVNERFPSRAQVAGGADTRGGIQGWVVAGTVSHGREIAIVAGASGMGCPIPFGFAQGRQAREAVHRDAELGAGLLRPRPDEASGDRVAEGRLPHCLRGLALRLREDRLHLRRGGGRDSKGSGGDAGTGVPKGFGGDPRGCGGAVRARLRKPDGGEHWPRGRRADFAGRGAVLGAAGAVRRPSAEPDE